MAGSIARSGPTGCRPGADSWARPWAARAITSEDHLSEMAIVLRSIPGIGPVASSMLIAEMPEIGTITGAEAAALTGLALVAHDSGTLRGKRTIAGGRRALRQVMF